MEETRTAARRKTIGYWNQANMEKIKDAFSEINRIFGQLAQASTEAERARLINRGLTIVNEGTVAAYTITVDPPPGTEARPYDVTADLQKLLSEIRPDGK